MDFSAKELVTVGDLLGLTLDVNASVTLSVDVADNTDKLNLEVKLEKVKEMEYEWVY